MEMEDGTMVQELPTMNTTSYTSNTYTGDIPQLTSDDSRWADTQILTATRATPRKTFSHDLHGAEQHKEKVMAKTTRRYVQIFIVDPDTRMPLNRSALYEGESFLTDLTDQELFYELEIKTILAEYNAYRVTVLDKKASDKFGRDVLLEEVKIRDLSMTVVEIATF